MSQRTSATRYARALLDVASREADLDQVGRELQQFVDLLKQQPALERVLMNPAVPAPRKKAAVSELTKIAAYAPVVSKLLILLAERDRLALLPHVSAIYQELLLDRQNIVRAQVTSAEPLPQDRIAAIEKQLAALTGKRVSLTATVDKNIMGGIIARVGSTVYDASLATQLKKIRERMTA